MRHGVQPAAREFLRSEIVSIEHFGTHSCRRRYGREDAPWSEHATGNAIDIAGFVLADGRRISVKNDWAVRRKRGAFLRAVRDSACSAFGTVLGPDYNAAQADRFHLDQAGGRIGWNVCRWLGNATDIAPLRARVICSGKRRRAVAQDDKRTGQRSKVMLMVAVRFAGDPQVHRLRIRDIAAGGARLSYRGGAIAGDALAIEFPALGEVGAHVAWMGDGEIGVRFVHAIDPEAARITVTGEYREPAPELARQGLRRI